MSALASGDVKGIRETVSDADLAQGAILHRATFEVEVRGLSFHPMLASTSIAASTSTYWNGYELQPKSHRSPAAARGEAQVVTTYTVTAPWLRDEGGQYIKAAYPGEDSGPVHVGSDAAVSRAALCAAGWNAAVASPVLTMHTECTPSSAVDVDHSNDAWTVENVEAFLMA